MKKYPAIEIKRGKNATVSVVAENDPESKVRIPLSSLGESFAQTAITVLGWCRLYWRATDCFRFGKSSLHPGGLKSMRLLPMTDHGDWEIQVVDSRGGAARMIRPDGRAIETAVDSMVKAVLAALKQRSER